MICRPSPPLPSSGSSLHPITWGLIGSLLLWAQKPSPLPQAYDALRKNLTLNARRLLQEAREHPDSAVRHEAILMLGHLAARSGQEEEALHHWYFLSQRAPASPFGQEATYLRADLLLRRREGWTSGLYLLRSLIEAPDTDPTLRREAEKRLLYFVYRQATPGFLWEYLENPAIGILYPYVFAALRYHLRQTCLWPAWRLAETRHASTCKTPPPDSLTWQGLTDSLPVDTFRLVLLLPLMAMQERSSPFLEFWQGFELGLQESASPYPVWQVRIEDSERNPFRIQELLTLCEVSPPHLVVGEVSWSLNRPIADFCTRKGIWHAIPINPAYPDGVFSFPLSVPAECQGFQIAQRLFLGGSSSSWRAVCLYEADDPQAQAFVKGLRKVASPPAHPIPGRLSELTRRWGTLRDSLKEVDTFILALTREEALAFLLHQLGRDTLPPLVVCMEAWHTFSRTQLRDYHRLRLWVPQTLLPDSGTWAAFSQKVLRTYYQPPTFFHAQGYDAARFLAALSASYSRETPPAGSYEGLLNRYSVPPDCERYRLRVWAYEKGDLYIAWESP